MNWLIVGGVGLISVIVLISVMGGSDVAGG